MLGECYVVMPLLGEMTFNFLSYFHLKLCNEIFFYNALLPYPGG